MMKNQYGDQDKMLILPSYLNGTSSCLILTYDFPRLALRVLSRLSPHSLASPRLVLTYAVSPSYIFSSLWFYLIVQLFPRSL